MTRSLIAGLTALTLSLTPAAPATAQQFDQEALSKLLFGLVAALAVGTIVKNANDKEDDRALPASILPFHDLGGLGPAVAPSASGGAIVLGKPGRRPPIEVPRATPHHPPRLVVQPPAPQPLAALPGDCIRDVHGLRGPERILGLRCLDNRLNISQRLPKVCFRQIQTAKNVRRGFNLDCLRGAGYRFR